MNVARLRVLVDGSAAGALKALAAARVATKATAKTMNSALMPALKATAAGFAVLGGQATVGGVVALGNALVPLVGLVGVLPGALVGAAAAAGTLKLALSGVGDAISNWDDPKAFKQSLDALTPAARSFVKALKDVHDNGFEQLELDVQESLFAGLGKTIKDLAGTYLPVLDPALMAIAASMRRVIEEVSAFLTQSDTVKDVSTILDNVRKAFADLGGAVTPIVQVFRDLTVVSSTFLPGLATGATGVAEKLRDMVAAGRSSGGIADFIQAGIDTAKQLGTVLGNVGSILHSVFAAGGDGAGLLTTIQTITGDVAAFLKTVQGQDALKTFFASASQAASTLMPVISAVLPVIASISKVLATLATGAAPGVVTAVKAIGSAFGTLGPAASVLGGAVGDILTNLAGALPPVATLFSTLVKAAAPVLTVISKIVAAFASALAPALDAVLPALSEGLQTIGNAIVGVMPAVTPALTALGTAFAQLAGPVGGLIAQLITGLVPTIANLVATVVPVLMPALLSLVPVISTLIGAFSQIVAALAPVIAQLVAQLAPIITAIAPDISKLAKALGQMLLAIVPLLPPIIQFAGFILQSLLPVIDLLADALVIVVKAFTAVIKVVQPIVSGLFDAIYAAVNAVGTAIGDFAYGVVSAVKLVGNIISTGLTDLWNLPGRIIGLFSGAGSWLLDAGKSIVKGLISGIWSMVTSPVDGLQSILGKVTDLIPDWKGPASVDAKLLAPAGQLVMGGFIDSIKDAIPTLHSTLSGITTSVAMTPVPVLGAATAGGAGMAASASAGGTVNNVYITIPAGTTATDAAAISAHVETAVSKVLGTGVLTVRQQRGR